MAEFERRFADIAARIAAGERLEELDKEAIVGEWEADLVRISDDEVAEVFRRRQSMTKKQRKAAKDKTTLAVEAFVRHLMIRARILDMQPMPPFGDRWLEHPLPRLNEPAKLVCHLTDRGTPPQDDTAWDALAHLYNRASLHAVDNFFQLARRSFNLLDRSENTATTGRIHFIYLPFDPAMVIKMVDIHRVVFNYTLVSPEKNTTPAMRLGLANRPMTLRDLLDFPGIAPPMKRSKPKIPRKSAAKDEPPAATAPAADVSHDIPF